MATNHVSSGSVMNYVNGTGKDIVSGQAIAVGASVGIALVDIPKTATGAVALEGVWEIPKATAVTAEQGGALIFGAATKGVKAAAANGDIEGGIIAFEEAKSGQLTAIVKLVGPGTVKSGL